MSWHEKSLAGFDVESSGVDVENDRIVTASIVHIDPNRNTYTNSHLIAVDVEIPEAAQAVHGISTEHAREHGRPAADVLEEVCAELQRALSAGFPVVTMNGSFDFTMLDRECRRNKVPTLGERLHGNVRPVIDVRCLDKQVDKFRSGGRKLTDLCRTYRVRIDGAHDAAADALAACRVAWRIAEMYPEIVGIDLDELHDKQIDWHREQVEDFAAFRLRKGQPLDDVCTDWPVRTFPVEAVAS